MIRRARPADYPDLLKEAVASARLTRFWRQKLAVQPLESLADFERLPFTSVEEYRQQSFTSVVADPDGIEWIPGPWLGQLPDRVPMAEGPAEAKVRVDLMTDAIRPALPNEANGSTALVITTGDRRHFGAETCAALVRMGIPTHLVVDEATDRLEYLTRVFEPEVIVALSPAIDLMILPDSVNGIVTVGHGFLGVTVRHVDLLVQNELGVLGASYGPSSYVMHHHRFHFEESPRGTLAVTPYFSRVQPLIRLDTGMPASVLH